MSILEDIKKKGTTYKRGKKCTICFIPLHTHVTCRDMKTVIGESFTEEVVAYILELVSKIVSWPLIL